MGRYSNDPIILENCISIDLKHLKKLGYLKPDQIRAGGLQWRSGKQIIGKLSIIVNTIAPPYIQLEYVYRGEPVKRCIWLTNIKPPIGDGRKWFFVCPVSGKRCTKLYLINGFFVHRLAAKGVFYQKQIESHKDREFYGVLGFMFDKMELPKHYKTHYSGNPTKRFTRYLNKVEKIKTVLPGVLGKI